MCATGCKSNSLASNHAGASQSLGPSGGIADGPDGEELRVPGGALTKPTTFTLRVAEPDEYPAAGSYSFSGSVFAFEPHFTKFLSPATVAIPFTTTPAQPVLLRAEPGDAAWSELAVSGTGPNSLEATVSTLSYFVVADKGASVPDGSTPSCSGRAPVNGAPEGTVTSASGVIPGAFFVPATADFDTSALQSGFATPEFNHPERLDIVLADYAQACGLAKNNDTRNGGGLIALSLPAPVSAQSYAAGSVNVGGNRPDDGAHLCDLAAFPFSPPDANGAGVTITAVDATHIAGTYDVFVGTSPPVEIQGTFDVPICAVDSSITPACCLP